MSIKRFFPALPLVACVALLAACASEPAATTPAAKPVAPVAAAPAVAPESAVKTEKDTADALEVKSQEAARSYKVVERDGKTLYCKREKRIGTTIPTMQCLTESQLRNQVETMEDTRNRMRNNGKCT